MRIRTENYSLLRHVLEILRTNLLTFRCLRLFKYTLRVSTEIVTGHVNLALIPLPRRQTLASKRSVGIESHSPTTASGSEQLVKLVVDQKGGSAFLYSVDDHPVHQLAAFSIDYEMIHDLALESECRRPPCTFNLPLFCPPRLDDSSTSDHQSIPYVFASSSS